MQKEWRLHPAPTGDAMGGTDLPPIVTQILHNRDITTPPQIEAYLNPTLHDPMLMPGMEQAIGRLRKALDAGEAIGVFGDFDVDGVTATALIAQGLGELGAKVIPYIPHRVTEGHGLNPEAVQALHAQGISVLVTVDCGVTSYSEVSLAQELGVDVIVTDHHIPPDRLPPAISIIDPYIQGSEYPFSGLSGAGLAFKLVQGLYESLDRPWSQNLLELAALSTVADLVPLRDENRYLVREGLESLRRTQRPGLQALYKRADIRPERIDSETISFAIAPRLNAAGRLEDASTSYGLLLERSPDQADILAARLEALNRERQRATEEGWARVHEEVAGWSQLPAILIVHDDELSPGIAGLVASRLVDQFYRPAVVMTTVDGLLRASARSIPEFHIGEALSMCGDLFARHGGHRGAAGFQMLPERLDRLRERLGKVADERLEEIELNPVIGIDAEVLVGSLVGQTFKWLKRMEPFGVDNRPPTFLSRGLQLMHARSVGGQGQHLKLKLKDSGRAVWDAMAFRQADQLPPEASSLDVVYTIGTEWRGTDLLALNILDFRPAAG